jgi:UDP-3-O-acyl-N-acetylglucosamine deacetylase
MTQGGAYSLPVTLKIGATDIDISTVDKVEFTFDTLKKIYGGTGTVTYDADNKQFLVPLSQAETFGFNKIIRYQARVLWKSGLLSPTDIYTDNIAESLSEDVLV